MIQNVCILVAFLVWFAISSQFEIEYAFVFFAVHSIIVIVAVVLLEIMLIGGGGGIRSRIKVFEIVASG